MKLLLIGAASAAALAIAAPAAAQYPPPPPPPPDADQYGAQDQGQGAYDEQAPDQAYGDAAGPQDMGPPDDEAGPPDQGQGYGQDQGYDRQDYGPPPGSEPPPAYPPPPGGQGYVPPSQDHYGPAEGGYAGPPPPPPDPYAAERAAPPSYAAPGAPEQRFEGGPTPRVRPGLAEREDRLERRIRRLADRGGLDPRSADALLSELGSIQDEQARLMQERGALDVADERRLNQRLTGLAQRLRAMTRGPE